MCVWPGNKYDQYRFFSGVNILTRVFFFRVCPFLCDKFIPSTILTIRWYNCFYLFQPQSYRGTLPSDFSRCCCLELIISRVVHTLNTYSVFLVRSDWKKNHPKNHKFYSWNTTSGTYGPPFGRVKNLILHNSGLCVPSWNCTKKTPFQWILLMRITTFYFWSIFPTIFISTQTLFTV